MLKKMRNTEIKTHFKAHHWLFLVLLILLATPQISAWWSDDYGFRKQINITENSDRNLSGYSLMLNVSYDTDMNGSFSDLRFVNDDDVTELGYWVEYIINHSSAWVWVNIPYINTSYNNRIYMYYGNSSKTSASNMTKAFWIADDFEDGAIAGMWNTQGDVEETNGWINVTATAVLDGFLWQEVNGNENVSIRTKARRSPRIPDGDNAFVGWGLNGKSVLYLQGLKFYNDVVAVRNFNNLIYGNVYNSSTEIWYVGDLSDDGLTQRGTLYNETNNYELLGTGSHNHYTDCTNLTIADAKEGGGGILVDWVFIRNYTNPEPSYAFLDEETPLFNITSITYTSPVTEGSTQRFELNITYNSTYYPNIQGNLYYNNTQYIGTAVENGDNASLSRTLDIPEVTTDTNISFWWEIILINDTYQYSNSSVYNQSVLDIGIDDCTTYGTLLLNYTLRDEETQAVVVGATSNTTVEIEVLIYPLGTTTPIFNFTGNFTENNNPQVCLESNIEGSTYEMYVTTFYDGDGYSPEQYYIQNFTLVNDSLPQNINLFDLADASAQKFLITFKDENFLPVEDAVIDIQRKYVSEGLFKTVERPRTDQFGQTIGYFDLDNVIYTIVVSRYGTILATFDNVAVVCQDIVIEDCQINLNAVSTGVDVDDWEEVGGITHTWSFDADTRTVTVIFTTISGGTSAIVLNSTRFDRFGNVSVCSDTLTSSSGTLTCAVPDSFGNLTITSKLYADGELVASKIYTISEDIGDYFGRDRYVILLIFLLIIPMMFITSPIMFVLGIIITFVFTGALMLFSDYDKTALIWLIVAGGVLIWGMVRRLK